MTKIFACSFAALLLAASVGTASAATPYDGSWSVLIITHSGTCDAAYRIPLKIENGRVSYAGNGTFKVSGRIGTGGAVNVNIIYGTSTVGGAGRMTPRSGAGTWSGSSSSATCSGRWQAERAS